MYSIAGRLISMAIIAWMCIEGSPVGDSKEKRENFVKAYDKLRQPLKDILLTTRRMATLFAKEKGLKDVRVHESLWKSCKNQIGTKELKDVKDRQKRLIYAMKVHQELVKQLQIMQVKESVLSKGKCTSFTHDFRELEFKIRRFVETNLRDAAKSIYGSEAKKQMPAYSIGNSHQIEVKETNTGEFNKQNLEVLKAVLFCGEKFLQNDIVAVAGRDRFMEERRDGGLFKTNAAPKQDMMDQLLQHLSDVVKSMKDSKWDLP